MNPLGSPPADQGIQVPSYSQPNRRVASPWPLETRSLASVLKDPSYAPDAVAFKPLLACFGEGLSLPNANGTETTRLCALSPAQPEEPTHTLATPPSKCEGDRASVIRTTVVALRPSHDSRAPSSWR